MMPLPLDRRARPAGRAAECAFAVGRFPEMHRLLFEKRDSLITKPWESFARDAGIPGTKTFSRCVADTTNHFSFDQALALARKVKLRTIPTIVINGWVFNRRPTDSALVAVISALQLGKSPPGAASTPQH
jgi:protein-disulfide isomerase